MPATSKVEEAANGCGVNDIGVKCGEARMSANEEEANKNITAAVKIKELMYFISVILAKTKPKPFASISIITKKNALVNYLLRRVDGKVYKKDGDSYFL